MSNSFKLNLVQRPRRLRRTAELRALVEETVLRPADFIAPVFVIDGKGRPEPIESMPGVFRLNIADLVKECRALRKLGVLAVALFPKLDSRLKDEEGTAALREDALILRAVRAMKKAVPDMIVMTDIALDPYTTHGHDGVLTAGRRRRGQRPHGRDLGQDGRPARLRRRRPRRAKRHDGREGGGDPQGARRGRTARIRQSWPTRPNTRRPTTGRSATPWAAPRPRAPAASTSATYQLNPANRREALTELGLDEAEGADIVMVKPAGLYLDIIRELRRATKKPIAAYIIFVLKSGQDQHAGGRVFLF